MISKTDRLLSLYSRKGGKKNRAEQVTRIKAVLRHAHVSDPYQLGNKHVIDFYKYLRSKNTSERTIYYYYLSIINLYKILGRSKPPEPHYNKQTVAQTEPSA
jgi:hypothetical protein